FLESVASLIDSRMSLDWMTSGRCGSESKLSASPSFEYAVISKCDVIFTGTSDPFPLCSLRVPFRDKQAEHELSLHLSTWGPTYSMSSTWISLSFSPYAHTMRSPPGPVRM